VTEPKVNVMALLEEAKRTTAKLSESLELAIAVLEEEEGRIEKDYGGEESRADTRGQN
jgi:hypothetical protein